MLNPEVPFGPTVVPRPPNPGCVACRGTGWIVDRGRRDVVRDAVAAEGWEDRVLDEIADELVLYCPGVWTKGDPDPDPDHAFARLRAKKRVLEATIEWALCGDIGLALRPPKSTHKRELRRSRRRARRWGRAWVVEGLAAAGQRQRQITALTGIPKSTVHDLARSGRIAPKGMDTHSAPTIHEELAELRDEVQHLRAGHIALRGDFEAHKAEVERQLGRRLPAGGIDAAVVGLEEFLASVGQEYVK
jgi:hypothetical protein